MKRPLCALVLPCLLLAFPALPAFSQELAAEAGTGAAPLFPGKFQAGLSLYHEGRWLDAAAELRNAQESAETDQQWAEALYWIILAELAAADYGSALRDMDELEKGAPGSGRSVDIAYHRARAYYYLGYYEDAITLFKKYSDGAEEGEESRRSAALYWIGECLFSLGQLDRAQDFFNLIVTRYPGSVKYEAATYRLELIKQKKIEIELLTLLKWSHEESLRTVEEYQRREKNYDQALNAYQKRLADSKLEEIESANAGYRRQLAEAGERIRLLEERLASGAAEPSPDELRARARRLRNELQWELDNLETAETPAPAGSARRAPSGGGGSR